MTNECHETPFSRCRMREGDIFSYNKALMHGCEFWSVYNTYFHFIIFDVFEAFKKDKTQGWAINIVYASEHYRVSRNRLLILK